MRKITVIFDNFGPYHIARLTGAARKCDLLGIEIAAASAVYAWQATVHVPFQRRTLFQGDRIGARDPMLLVDRLRAVLTEHGTEVLAIPGWSGPHAVAALRVANDLGIPVILMSDSQAVDFERGFVKEWVKRRYVALCQSGLVGGTPHRAYLAGFGMNPARIYLGYDVVDNASFATRSDEARGQAAALRQSHHLPMNYFLASARFIPKKNLDRLIRAYAEYRRLLMDSGGHSDVCWDLMLLGDGELRTALAALIDRLGLSTSVHLPGFKQYTDLPVFYGLAGAFVHASTTEQWGLVVNEAMASGLPVIVSMPCGCATDLVEEGRNGFIFDPLDVDALARLLLKIASDDCDRASMGQASREIIGHWSPETFGEGLVKAAECALTAPPARLNWLDRGLLWALARR